MKRKHYGITSIIVIFVSMTAILGYGIYLARGMKSKTKVSYPAPIPDTAIPDQSTMARMKVLNQALYSLVTLSKDPAPSGLKIFGYTPVKSSTGSPQRFKNNFDKDHAAKELFSYDLSLCFSSKTNSFCVIDSILYRKNALLPDNERIIKIEHDRVQIRKNSVTKWIYLSMKDNQAVKEKQVLKEKTGIEGTGNI